MQALDGRAISVQVKRCEGKDYCATIDESNEYADKHYAFYYLNEQIYNPNDYSENVLQDLISSTVDRLDHQNARTILYSI